MPSSCEFDHFCLSSANFGSGPTGIVRPHEGLHNFMLVIINRVLQILAAVPTGTVSPNEGFHHVMLIFIKFCFAQFGRVRQALSGLTKAFGM